MWTRLINSYSWCVLLWSVPGELQSWLTGSIGQFSLPPSSAPNFSLAPALDVLTTGTYPRLPTCIKDRILPLPPLKEEEEKQAFSLINCTIRRRLLREKVPDRMAVTFIGEEKWEEGGRG